jgi:hypothetical protein
VKAATKRATAATGKAVKAKPASTAKTKSVTKGKENKSGPASGPVKAATKGQVAKVVVNKVRFVYLSSLIPASLSIAFRHLSPLSRRNSLNRSQFLSQGVSQCWQTTSLMSWIFCRDGVESIAFILSTYFIMISFYRRSHLHSSSIEHVHTSCL